MREERIGRATHAPLGDQYINLDFSRDMVLVPTRRRNGNVPSNILYQEGVAIADPEVFIEVSHIDNGSGFEDPYYILGENTLCAWMDKDRSVIYDYRLDLGFSMTKETLDLLEGIMEIAEPDQREIMRTDLLDPYACRVTLTEGVAMIDLSADHEAAGDSDLTDEEDNEEIENVVFTLFPGGYNINTRYSPIVNAGWSGYPPQKIIEAEQKSVYEIVTAMIEVPPKLALDHRIKYGTVIPQMVSMIRGVEFLQRDFSPMSQDILALVDSGIRTDFTIRRLINPFVRFQPGMLTTI